MAQLISDGRNGFQSAREVAQASPEANVQVTSLSSGDGNELPSSLVIEFSPLSLLFFRFHLFPKRAKYQNGCISGSGICLMFLKMGNVLDNFGKVDGLIWN